MTFQTKIICYGYSMSTHKIISKIEGTFYINLRISNLAEYSLIQFKSLPTKSLISHKLILKID